MKVHEKDFESIIAGILIGFLAFFVKIVMTNIILDLFLILKLVINPLIWLASIFGVLGFFFMQKALYKSNISRVIPVVAGFSILLPVLLAITFLGEFISFIKWIGIGLILLGIIWLGKS